MEREWPGEVEAESVEHSLLHPADIFRSEGVVRYEDKVLDLWWEVDLLHLAGNEQGSQCHQLQVSPWGDGTLALNRQRLIQ